MKKMSQLSDINREKKWHTSSWLADRNFEFSDPFLVENWSHEEGNNTI